MLLLGIAAFLALAACGGGGAERPDVSQPSTFTYPPAPTIPPSLGADATGAARKLISGLVAGNLDQGALDEVVASRDPRMAWLVSDLLRFIQSGSEQEALVAAFGTLTGVDASPDPAFAESPWKSITNHLFAWDLPAPPRYRDLKGRLFTQLEPGWQPFFDDADSEIDWRVVSWGGVLIDNRRPGDKEPCPRGCIPALDDPPVTAAARGNWYPDDRLVFGVVVGDEALALPKNIMEVHEIVNITLGGRRLGIPYCTLCGSAQAYLTDAVPEGVDTPVLRTSGLLSRSNKVMYDLRTHSVFDTFTGRALSGPLHERKIILRQATLVTSTWGEWKAAHPDTRILARDGGLGRSYPADPLGGRDDNGPIFPIGPADPRLPVQAKVLGVIGSQGPVAFPVDQARSALADGASVEAAGVSVSADGGGLRARVGGRDVPAHEAFWFAWSQFNPDTVVWTPLRR